MQTGYQLAAVHGMLYTGGNVCFSPDGRQLLSPVNNYITAIQLQSEGHLSHTVSNSSIQCFDLSPDGDLMVAIGHRGLGFFYSVSARVVLDTISFPPGCAIPTVKFSPCGKYIALALENTLQVYTAPAKRVVSYHACHRVENLHSVLTLPIMNLEWTPDSEHIMVSGQDARIKIVPRQGRPNMKGTALQQNSLIGHRSAVLGAWFVNDDGSRAVSVAADNVAVTWRRTPYARREVLQAIATANVNARVADVEDDEDDDEEEGGGKVPRSFLEKQRVERLRLEGVRVSVADDSQLPEILRNAYEVEKKFMLTHKGNVSTCAFHKGRGLVAIGYNSGIFAIHSLTRVEGGVAADDAEATVTGAVAGKNADDDFPLVHLLSISAQALTTAAFSPSGAYVAFGSAHLKQLLVWDWTAEAYVLKEQAHYYDIARTAITADSTNIISGGEDGKVKVWKASSGQCFVTFTEHTGAITGLCTSAATNAFFTCSLDGTARGYDLVRYRSFRTFTAPDGEATQFSCVAVDPSGDVLAVGSSRVNKIFLFSVQTGRVVDVLQGHEAPIACIAFHPSGTTLTSGSMDHNIVLWDLFNSNEGGERLKGTGEVLDIGSEVLFVAYSNSGRRMAVLTAKQEISVYETTVPTEPELIKTFQTSFDAAGGWSKNVGPNSKNYGANFTRIAFSPEGEKILAGGDAKWLVLYHATQGYVLNKWPITTNLDVLGAEEQYNWRAVTETGFLGDIDIADDDAQLARRKLLEMPGSRNRHFATGQRKTEMAARCMDLAFASTGSEFVAATTDGLLVFSTRVARPRFQPLQLTSSVTTAQAREKLESGQPVLALMEALILGDRQLGIECMRRLSRDAIPVAMTSTPSAAFPLLAQWVSEEVEGSRSLEQALLWAQSLLMHSNEALGSYAQDNSVVLPALKTLQRALHQHRMLTQLSRENYFSLQYITEMARMGKHGREEMTLREEDEDEGGLDGF